MLIISDLQHPHPILHPIVRNWVFLYILNAAWWRTGSHYTQLWTPTNFFFCPASSIYWFRFSRAYIKPELNQTDLPPWRSKGQSSWWLGKRNCINRILKYKAKIWNGISFSYCLHVIGDVLLLWCKTGAVLLSDALERKMSFRPKVVQSNYVR